SLWVFTRHALVNFGGERPQLDRAVCCCRAACCPLQRGIERRALEQREPAELLLGIRVRAVLDQTLAVPLAHRRARLRSLQRSPARKDAGLDDGLVPRLPGAGVVDFIGLVLAAVEIVW